MKRNLFLVLGAVVLLLGGAAAYVWFDVPVQHIHSRFPLDADPSRVREWMCGPGRHIHSRSREGRLRPTEA